MWQVKLGLPIISLTVILGFLEIFQLSAPGAPRHANVQRYLSPSWLGPMDLSDHQHRFFRNNIPILSLVAAIHVLIGYLANRKYIKQISIAFSIVFLVVLHGLNIIKLLFLLCLHYDLTKRCNKTTIGLVWVLQLLLLLFIDKLDFNVPFQGMISQWTVYYKFSVLRVLSFSMDILWKDTSKPHSKRIARYCEDASFTSFLMYTLYTPLYLAGPIITYNDFTNQVNKKPSMPTIKPWYLTRFLATLLFMEVFNRYCHFNAILKDGKRFGFHHYSSIQLCLLGYGALMHIWLKLLLMWRFFRIWALLDGIETHENMTKCMSNHYSPMNFWKHWHVSFNKWLVRYIYVPLGGNTTYVWNIWPIFTFVALWHDVELKLLIWGMLIPLFILPEYICKRLFSQFKSKSWYLDAAALGSVINVSLMMTGNLVGYALGPQGTLLLWERILEAPHQLISIILIVYFAVHLMFAHENYKKVKERI